MRCEWYNTRVGRIIITNGIRISRIIMVMVSSIVIIIVLIVFIFCRIICFVSIGVRSSVPGVWSTLVGR